MLGVRIRIIIAALGTLVFVFCVSQYRAYGEPVLMNRVAPHFILKGLDGSPIDFAEMNGKVVILNFWASWCSPCKAEFSSMIELSKSLSDQPFLMIAVSLDENDRQVSVFLKNYPNLPANLMVAWDPERLIALRFGTEKLPESYLIDSTGMIVKKVISAHDWMDPSTYSEVWNILGATKTM